MEFPIRAEVVVNKGKYKGAHGVITQIINGWYTGHAYTVRFDNQKVKMLPRRYLDFVKWDPQL